MAVERYAALACLVVCLLLAGPSQLTGADPCGTGWTLFGGHCYENSWLSDTYWNQKARCTQSYSYLVNIGSGAEQGFVARLAGINSLSYIGYYQTSPGHFVWDNTGKDGTYNLLPSPLNSDQCVAMSYRIGVTWQQVKCSSLIGLTCERDLDECLTGVHQCHANATCVNIDTSYNCLCKPGFSGDGRACTRIILCSNFSTPVNGQKSTPSTVAGTMVNFTCLPGFRLVGPNSIKCQNNSQWSGAIPTCPDVDECVSGSHDCGSNALCSNVAGSFNCKCANMYKGDGKTCTDLCPSLKVPANGFKINNFDQFQVIFRCRSGYALSGLSKVTCQRNGQWNGSPPTCVDVDECTTRNHDCDVHASCANTIGSYNCACLPPTKGNGRVCTNVVCPSLSSPPNGTMSGSGVLYTNPRSFTCNSGYTLIGSSSRVCQIDGTWSGQPAKCVDVDECLLGQDTCSVHASCSNTVGSYTCTCLLPTAGDGRTCKPVICPNLGPPTDGFMTGSSITYNSVRIFSCIPGRTLVGSVSRVCLADGSWSGIAATCKVPESQSSGGSNTSLTLGLAIPFSLVVSTIIIALAIIFVRKHKFQGKLWMKFSNNDTVQSG